MLTRYEKASATRALNKMRAKWHERSLKAWETRRANALERGRIDADGQPTLAERKKRRRIALKAWVTRRASLSAMAAD